jgi:hypothetical protein
MTGGMNLALAGFFLALGIGFLGFYERTGNVASAIIGGAFALAAIRCASTILRDYRGDKR